MARVHRVPLWQRAVILLTGTIVGLVVVMGLKWARPILVPIALAVLLTFLLNPVVRILQRRGLGRIVSVLAAVSTAGIVLMCLGWIVTRQVGSMLAELPQNTANIAAKVKALRELGSGPTVEHFGQMIEEISRELPQNAHAKTSVDKRTSPNEGDSQDSAVETVVLRAESPSLLGLRGYLGSALEVLATLAFALVLLVFFLVGREDLRDRIVLLTGKARLTLTSKAWEDVTDRISRYIVMVAMLNGGFGVLLTTGLLLLQVPYALLWGFLAAALRFIPYIGPWVGAVFPIVMSFAISEGWWQPLAVFGYVVALELTSNNIVEPLVFGRSTGVSATALLISAAFWFYLWGPIGLVFSTPFTVCLVVLGKNIPQLSFLSLLLGDTPALRANVGLYQRLILGDEHEAIRLVLQRMKTSPAGEVFDQMLIPVLNYTQRDVQRDHLSDEDQRVVLEGMRSALRQTDEVLRTTSASPEQPQDPSAEDPNAILAAPQPTEILGCPATNDTDCVGLEMLRQLLDPAHWKLEQTTVNTLAAELVARVVAHPPAIICIASLPPGGMSRARYLCKRLRAASPKMPIIVGRWGQQRNGKIDRDRLEQAGASFVTSTLLETQELLQSQLPLLMKMPSTMDVADLATAPILGRSEDNGITSPGPIDQSQGRRVASC